MAMITPLIAMLLCPGQTTLEIQACTSRAVDQSDALIRLKLNPGDFDDWTAMRERFCSLAKEPLKDGSIHGQVLLSCFQGFNQLLLDEFRSLAEPPLQHNKASGEWVNCIIKSESGHQFNGGCLAQPFDGNGSFHLSNAFQNVDLIPGIKQMTISVEQPDQGWVTYQELTPSQSTVESRSPVQRQDGDNTCWITRGLSICID